MPNTNKLDRVVPSSQLSSSWAFNCGSFCQVHYIVMSERLITARLEWVNHLPHEYTFIKRLGGGMFGALVMVCIMRFTTLHDECICGSTCRISLVLVPMFKAFFPMGVGGEHWGRHFRWLLRNCLFLIQWALSLHKPWPPPPPPPNPKGRLAS